MMRHGMTERGLRVENLSAHRSRGVFTPDETVEDETDSKDDCWVQRGRLQGSKQRH